MIISREMTKKITTKWLLKTGVRLIVGPFLSFLEPKNDYMSWNDQTITQKWLLKTGVRLTVGPFLSFLEPKNDYISWNERKFAQKWLLKTCVRLTVVPLLSLLEQKTIIRYEMTSQSSFFHPQYMVLKNLIGRIYFCSFSAYLNTFWTWHTSKTGNHLLKMHSKK